MAAAALACASAIPKSITVGEVRVEPSLDQLFTPSSAALLLPPMPMPNAEVGLLLLKRSRLLLLAVRSEPSSSSEEGFEQGGWPWL